MDSSSDQDSAPNSMLPYHKHATTDSLKVGATKKSRFEASRQIQAFSLTDSIIYYITKNPSSPELYQKIIQTCKYFFIKNPIFVIPYLSFQYGEWTNHSEEHLYLDKNVSKIWITDSLSACDVIEWIHNLVPSIIPRLFRCDAKDLFFIRQTFSFNELLFISSSAENVHFDEVTVKYENGSIVPFENIVEALPNVKWMTYEPDPTKHFSINSKTFIKLIFVKLDYLRLLDVPETFDIDSFYDCIKTNKHTEFRLHFDSSISQAYKNRLEKIIDEIIETKDRKYKPPFIGFQGLDDNKWRQLYAIYSNEESR